MIFYLLTKYSPNLDYVILLNTFYLACCFQFYQILALKHAFKQKIIVLAVMTLWNSQFTESSYKCNDFA